MDAIQGAVLKVKLAHIENWTEARRSVARRYDRLLAGGYWQLPAPPPHSRHVYHMYAVRVPQRDRVRKTLDLAGIETGIHYPVLVHLQKAYADLGYEAGDLPVSEAAADQFLSLPIYAEMQPESVAAVADELERVRFVDRLPPCDRLAMRSTAK